MKNVSIFLAFGLVLGSQVLSRVKERVDALPTPDHRVTITHQSAAPTVPQRKLIDAAGVKALFDKPAKENLWKVADPAENVIVVSEEVGGADVPLFKAILSEVEIPNTQNKIQYLTIENRPAAEGEDAQFGRYKLSVMLFRRKINPNGDNLLEAFIKKCCEMFKDLTDRIKAQSSAPAITGVVQTVLNELKVPGIVLEPMKVDGKRELFNIKDGVGNTRFYGFIYPLMDSALALSLRTDDTRFTIWNAFGAEVNFKGKITQFIARELQQPPKNVEVQSILAKLQQQIQARCPNDPPRAMPVENFPNGLSVVFKANEKSKPGDINRCIYADAKITAVKFQLTQMNYFHIKIEFSEMDIEDMILGDSRVFDLALGKSMDMNQRSIQFIRNSRAKTKSEVILKVESIQAALEKALKSKPKEEDISEAEKTAIESETNHFLKRFSFPNGMGVEILENESDFLILVSKKNLANGAITTTQYVLPKFNGVDGVGFVQGQIEALAIG